MKPQETPDSSESEDACPIKYTDTSDHDQSHDEEDGIVRQPTIQQISVDDFVVVAYEMKSRSKFFVGQVLGKENGSVEVKFFQRKGARFFFPSKEDIDEVENHDNIKAILPKPSSIGGTKRASMQYRFACDLSEFFGMQD